MLTAHFVLAAGLLLRIFQPTLYTEEFFQRVDAISASLLCQQLSAFLLLLLIALSHMFLRHQFRRLDCQVAYLLGISRLSNCLMPFNSPESVICSFLPDAKPSRGKIASEKTATSSRGGSRSSPTWIPRPQTGFRDPCFGTRSDRKRTSGDAGATARHVLRYYGNDSSDYRGVPEIVVRRNRQLSR